MVFAIYYTQRPQFFSWLRSTKACDLDIVMTLAALGAASYSNMK
jgi:hypothetical protein